MTVASSEPAGVANASSQEPAANGASTGPMKLFGRKFYESIGSPKLVLAPMVDRSEFAWRMLTRSFMDPKDSKDLLAYSPMLHARLFAENPGYRNKHFEPVKPESKSGGDESETLFLDGNPSIDRPLFMQFCANDPDAFLNAAREVAPYCDAVDLNLGCPQGIAKKGRYGAFLQEEPDLIYKLINKLHNELPIPVTAKFRIQETKEATLKYAKMILSAGASIITVHGRRREQKGHNTGLADWEYIRYLRDNLPPETVIFANGNILNHDDIQPCLDATGADGVMSAEGNLTDPTIFSAPPPVGSEGEAYWRGRNGKGGYRIDFILRRYLDIIHKYVLEHPPPERRPLFVPSDPSTHYTDPEPEPENTPVAEEDHDDGPPKKKQKRGKEQRTTSPNLGVMQGHLFGLMRPLVSKHTDIRDALARSRAGDISAFENILSMVERAVKEGLQEYEQFPERFDIPQEGPNGEPLTGSKATIAKYGRPWWVCQPYIRPLPEEAIEKGAMQPKKNAKNNAAKDATERGASGDGKESPAIGTPTNGLVSG